MRKRKRNIYMGANSTAKLPVFGQVDTDNEICLNAIATAYDSLNNIMLTRKQGAYDKTSPIEINGRFSVLRMLCRKYAPNSLPVIEQIHNIVMDNYRGKISDQQAIQLMKSTCIKNNLNPSMLDLAAMHINQIEMMRNQLKNKSPDPNSNLFFLWQQNNSNLSKKRRKKI